MPERQTPMHPHEEAFLKRVGQLQAMLRKEADDIHKAAEYYQDGMEAHLAATMITSGITSLMSGANLANLHFLANRADANADDRIRAAAPLLFAALQGMMHHDGDPHGCDTHTGPGESCPHWTAAERAIAKAKGE